MTPVTPLPKLLIIGAMKAGTTSLYMDLASHPDAYLADQKEPHCLCYDKVLTPPGLDQYAALYRGARPGQLCIDASTGYAKRPDFEGVVDRALQVLPEGFRVIYLVRDPVARIISQHHHEFVDGSVGPSIDEEVRRRRRYIDYSRYSYQVEPWLDKLGKDRVRIVRFEEYTAFRRETLRDLYEFVELTPPERGLEDAKVYNRSRGKPVKNAFWQAVRHSRAYRSIIRPLAPLKLRIALQRALLPKSKTELAPPSPATVEFIRSELEEDQRRLDSIMHSMTTTRPSV